MGGRAQHQFEIAESTLPETPSDLLAELVCVWDLNFPRGDLVERDVFRAEPESLVFKLRIKHPRARRRGRRSAMTKTQPHHEDLCAAF